MFNLKIFVLLTILGFTLGKPSVSPANQCKAKGNDVHSCVGKAVQTLMVESAHGFKDVGVPKMDPLVIPRMTLENGEGAVSLNLELVNATHRGLSKSHIVSAHADPEHYAFEINMTVPEYNIKGTYNVSGKIIMLPISGTGPSDITFSGLTTIWSFKGVPFMKNSKKHMKLTEFKVDMHPSGMHVQLDNLFNGNKQLGDTMNKFMNENWQEIFKQLKVVMEESFSQILMDIGTRALNKIPYTEMFPDMA